MSWNQLTNGALRAQGVLGLAGSAMPSYRGSGVRAVVHESTTSAVLELLEPIGRLDLVAMTRALDAGAASWATWVDATHVRVTASVPSVRVSVRITRSELGVLASVAQIPGDGGGGGGPPPSVWWSKYPAFYPELLPAGMNPGSYVAPPEPPDVDPTGPATTVATAGAFNAAAANPQTRIVIAAGSAIAGNLIVDADDILVQAEPGARVTGQMLIGQTAERSHVEIDGALGGDSVAADDRLTVHSAVNGQPTVNFYTPQMNEHIVLQRMNIRNSGNPNASAIELFCEQSAVLKCRIRCPGYALHTNHPGDGSPYSFLYLMGNNMLTQSVTTNGTGARLGSASQPLADQSDIVWFQQDIQTTGGTYECIRFNSITRAWVNSSRLRQRGIRFGNIEGPPPDELGVLYVTNNEIYNPLGASFFFSNVAAASPITGPVSLTFAGNTFFSSFDEAAWLAAVGTPGHPGETWQAAPNTFLPFTAYPASWGVGGSAGGGNVGDPALLV